MQKNTSSLLIVCGIQTLLIPSKSTHQTAGQFDPPSTSQSFTSEQDRAKFMKNNFCNFSNYSKSEFNRNFFFSEDALLKFNYKDNLGEKLFTGYILLVKDKEKLKDFLVNQNEEWVVIEEIISGKAPYSTSPLFTDAYKRLVDEMGGILKRQAQIFAQS